MPAGVLARSLSRVQCACGEQPACRRIHPEGRRRGRRPRHRVRRGQRLPRPARRPDRVGLDSRRGHDRRDLPRCSGSAARSSRRTCRRRSARRRRRSRPARSSRFPRCSCGAWCRRTCRSSSSAILGARARPGRDDPAAPPADRGGATTSCRTRRAPRAPRCCARPRAESAASVWIFRGMAVGAAVKLLVSLAFLLPTAAHVGVARSCRRRELALELAPALIGVGFILGYRQSGVLVAGSVVSALVLTPLIAWLGAGLAAPLFPETTKLVVGDVGRRRSGRATCATSAPAPSPPRASSRSRKGLPTMARRVRRGGAGHAEGGAAALAAATARIDRPRPARARSSSAPLSWSCSSRRSCRACSPATWARWHAAICAAGVGVFGLMFVAVAARIVGIVGVSSQPTSGVALITLLGVASIFAAAGWTDPAARAAVLTVGTIVAVAASKAGDISQDLQDGIPRRRDAGAPAVRAAHRRLVRMLGRRRDGAAARQCLHLRLARASRRRRPR